MMVVAPCVWDYFHQQEENFFPVCSKLATKAVGQIPLGHKHIVGTTLATQGPKFVRMAESKPRICGKTAKFTSGLYPNLTELQHYCQEDRANISGPG